MSQLAEQQRRERRIWAAAGSSHDGLIATMRIALPLAVGVLTAFLAFAPLAVGRDISFVLSKDRVDVASERMRVTRATYRGDDSKGQPFRLDAGSAVQATSRDPIVHLSQLNAQIQLSDGPATIRANRGRYDLDNENIAIDGPVRFDSKGGYHVTTRDVLVDMSDRLARSRGPVDGTMPLGHFSADLMHADLERRIVRLDGRARLHIVQGRSRGAR
ncbi:LPS export ABC transporter periplasmic protein LptC [Sphingomonas crusticola]|uniref:LPS export ABC transporter periplasmic protein LptC n=1 Tax=Sphingomonas crusticola TaxID=1697973 RepID=UPI000E21DB7C|nr:LPS export ABC transporter periplasmic protein LptC [Sphingomonas crusticola]